MSKCKHENIERLAVKDERFGGSLCLEACVDCRKIFYGWVTEDGALKTTDNGSAEA